MSTTAPFTQLSPLEFDHFDPGFAEFTVRESIPRIGQNDAGRNSDDVIAIIPLLARRLVVIAALVITRSFFTPSASATAAKKSFSSATSNVPAPSRGADYRP